MCNNPNPVLYIDRTKISQSAQKSDRYLKKLLNLKEYSEFQKNRDETLGLFEEFAKTLSHNTIKLLHTVLFKNVPQFDPPIRLYDISIFRTPPPPFYLQHPEIDELLTTLVENYHKMLCNVPQKKSGQYETAIAVWFTMCSNLRNHELAQVTFRQIKKILNRQPVQIKTKRRITSVTIAIIKPLFDLHFERVRQYITRYYHGKGVNFWDLKLVNISDTVINANIRSALYALAQERNIQLPEKKTYGIQSIRRLNTTLLSSKLSEYDVMQFNRHQSSSVSRLHYNTMSYGATKLDRMFGNLDGL